MNTFKPTLSADHFDLRTPSGVRVTRDSGSISMAERARSLEAGLSQTYINGTWQDSATDERWQHVHPATNEHDFQISVNSTDEVDLAVRAARQAFDTGPWSRMTGAASDG